MSYTIVHSPKRRHRCAKPDDAVVFYHGWPTGTVIECSCGQRWRLLRCGIALWFKAAK